MSNLGNPAGTLGSPGQARSKTDELKEQARHKADEIREAAGDMASRAREAAHETVDELRQTASQYMERGREKAYEMSESIESQIRNEPVKAVLIAAGIGFVIGLCFTRR